MITRKRLNEISKQIKGKRIAIIGDMMIDAYFQGVVNRISPEAPVPVVDIDNEFYRFGGAANVANNIVHLGGIPIPIGIIGNDSYGKIFKKLLDEQNISSEGIIIDSERPTTTKVRVIAESQHLVRIDKEIKTDISTKIEQKLLNYFIKNIKNVDAVILQDYNKGILTKRIISEIVEISNKHNKIITVDPKFTNFFEYKNVTLFKPNKSEIENAFAIKFENEQMLIEYGQKLLEKNNAKSVLITLSEKGIMLFEKGKNEITRIPTKARKVADVSGAGDTVISTLTLALTAGASLEEASFLANYAAGIVCEEVGIIPIDHEKLFEEVKLSEK